MKVYINEKCIGCGTCARYYQDYFKVINNKAKVIKEIQNSFDETAIKDAADFCPVNAIIIEND